MSARRATRHRGFTLIEILMSVAILAGLLVATAAAIGASTRAFRGNLASADMLQHGRNAMMRMAAELRSGSDHLPTTLGKQTTFSAGVTVTDVGITFHDEAGRLIAYKFDATAKTVTLKIDTATAAVLVRGVTAFDVRMVPTRSKQSVRTGGIYDELARMTITMTVKAVDKFAIGGETVTLTQSVTPRARLWE